MIIVETMYRSRDCVFLNTKGYSKNFWIEEDKYLSYVRRYREEMTSSVLRYHMRNWYFIDSKLVTELAKKFTLEKGWCIFTVSVTHLDWRMYPLLTSETKVRLFASYCRWKIAVHTLNAKICWNIVLINIWVINLACVSDYFLLEVTQEKSVDKRIANACVIRVFQLSIFLDI